VKRADLLALTEDALVALSNRGIVKKAQKELEAGRVPEIREEDDGTVVGVFEDGKEARLAPDTPLRDTTCSCGARGMCRHRVGLVLAYARANAAASPASASGTEAPGAGAPAFVPWSPASFDDDAIEKRIGKRTMARARALRRRGYVAKIRRPTAADPIPTVELSTATIRFLAPNDIAYAHSDSAEGTGQELIALAIWAYRVADETRPAGSEVEIEVAAEGAATVDATGLSEALALADDVLLEGVVHGRPSQAATFERARRALEAAKLTWPVLCVDEIEEQITAYHARSAKYRPAIFADLVAELHARDRAAKKGGELPARRILGSEESMETALDHLRLVSLGVRVTGEERQRRADVFLADPDTATVLVLRKEWSFSEDEKLPDGPDLAPKIVAAKATLRALASGNIVTAAASRRASRLLTLKTSRVARTSVTPSRGDYQALPEGLLVTNVAAYDAELRARPPRLIRPRILAESVCAVAIGEVVEVAYAPGAQELGAVVSDPQGNELLVRLVHRGVAPGALDMLAHALSGERGAPRYVSGSMRRTPRGLVLEPLTVVTEEGLHVLDLAPEETRHPMELATDVAAGDAMSAALARASAVLEDGAHRGLRHAASSYGDHVEAAVRALARVGLSKTAAGLEVLRDAVRRAQTSGDEEAERDAARAWVDARIRIRLMEEAI
jgi:hypothetical protein